MFGLLKRVFHHNETTFTIEIIDDLCVGCEKCVRICPQVFDMNGHLAIIKLESIPKHYKKACKEAADSCPVEAIEI